MYKWAVLGQSGFFTAQVFGKKNLLSRFADKHVKNAFSFRDTQIIPAFPNPGRPSGTPIQRNRFPPTKIHQTIRLRQIPRGLPSHSAKIQRIAVHIEK